MTPRDPALFARTHWRRSALTLLAAAGLLTGILAVPPALAATLVVDDGYTTPGTGCAGAGYSTIASAVTAASNGDTISVCNGTYTESALDLTRGGALASLTIEGESAAGVVVSEAGGARDGTPILYVGGQAGPPPYTMTATIKDLTLTDACHALYVLQDSDLFLDGVIVQDNSCVADLGGGLYAEGGGSAISIDGSTFQDNFVEDAAGGAIYAEDPDSLTITGSAFADNGLIDGETLCEDNLTPMVGGAIAVVGAGTSPSVDIVGTSFDRNFAQADIGDDGDCFGFGGAIAAVRSDVTVSGDSTFDDNWADRYGGAIYIDEASTLLVRSAPSPYTVGDVDCPAFRGNATNPRGYLFGSEFGLVDPDFRNLDREGGGAIFADADDVEGEIAITCGTFEDNGTMVVEDPEEEGEYLTVASTERGGAVYASGPVVIDVGQRPQVVSLTGFDGGDGFTLSLGGSTTGSFVSGANATAAAIQAGLEALAFDYVGNITVTGTTDAGPFLVAFGGPLAHADLGPLAVACTGCVGDVTPGEQETVEFRRNAAIRAGGALYVSAEYSADVSITGIVDPEDAGVHAIVFDSNGSLTGGGAIYARQPFLSDPVGSVSVSDALFIGNLTGELGSIDPYYSFDPYPVNRHGDLIAGGGAIAIDMDVNLDVSGNTWFGCPEYYDGSAPCVTTGNPFSEESSLSNPFAPDLPPTTLGIPANAGNGTGAPLDGTEIDQVADGGGGAIRFVGATVLAPAPVVTGDVTRGSLTVGGDEFGPCPFFRGNRAVVGGAIRAETMSPDILDVDVVIDCATFVENHAFATDLSSARGGAARLVGIVQVARSTFAGNTAAFDANRQVITLTDFSSGEDFTLALGLEATDPFTYGTNATASDIQSALEAFAAVGTGNVTVTGTTDAGPFTVEFTGPLAGTNIGLLSIPACSGDCYGTVDRPVGSGGALSLNVDPNGLAGPAIMNSTFTGNVASGQPGDGKSPAFTAHAIEAFTVTDVPITLRYVTIARQAATSGDVLSTFGPVEVLNSIIDEPWDDGLDVSIKACNFYELPTDLGGNFTSAVGCEDATTGTLTDTADIALSGLDAWGGPTETMALLPGSVAIDGAVECDPFISIDQRGRVRPYSDGLAYPAGCDAGAFERSYTETTSVASEDATTAGLYDDEVTVTGYHLLSGTVDPTGRIDFEFCYDATEFPVWPCETADIAQQYFALVDLVGNGDGTSSATMQNFDPTDAKVDAGCFLFHATYVPDRFTELPAFEYDGSEDDGTDETFAYGGTACGGAETTTETRVSRSSITYGGSVRDFATITVADGTDDPTGDVEFTYCVDPDTQPEWPCDDDGSIATATIVDDGTADGVARVQSGLWTPPGAGFYLLHASYLGDDGFSASEDDGTNEALVVAKAPTYVQLTSGTYFVGTTPTSLTATLTGLADCLEGRVVTFKLDSDGDGTYDELLGTATTGPSGAATLSGLDLTGYKLTIFEIEMTTEATDDCTDAVNTATVIVGGTGDSANGGGHYVKNGRINFGFTVQIKTSPRTGTTIVSGEMTWHKQGGKRVKGSITGYTKLSSCPPSVDTSGAVCALITGTASYYDWDGVARRWVLVSTGVGYRVTVADGGVAKVCVKKKCTTSAKPDWFAMVIPSLVVDGESDFTTPGVPVLYQLKGGSIYLK